MKKSFLVSLFLVIGMTLSGQTFDYSRISGHPRLLLKTGEEGRIEELIKNDASMRMIHEGILDICDGYLEKTPLKRVQIGRRILGTSREALQRIFFLSYAYRLTDKEVYAERAKKELLSVCNFTDWNPKHFLDVGEMTMAVAIGYDWLYDYLSEADRKTLSDAIYTKGFRAADNYQHARFYRMTSNWNQVCNAGLVYGALATYENHPQEAERIIEKAVETNRAALGSYGPDGGYPEGYTYWGYGTSFQVMMVAAMETIFGTEAGLTQAPGFMQSARFMQFMTTPTGKAFNFSDSGSQASINNMQYWFAAKQNDPTLLWLEEQALRKLPSDFAENISKRFITHRLLPSMLVFRAMSDFKTIDQPKSNFWINRGINPTFAYRSGWASPNDAYLGIKGGTANTSHAHMDAGTFIYEKDGVRWSIELGAESYEFIEKQGINLWGRDQDSERWGIFRLGNTGHSTLTMNGQRHQVEGKAEFVEDYRRKDMKGATLDLTPIFSKTARKTIRTAYLDADNNLNVVDKVDNGEKETEVCWTMVTPAEAKIAGKNRILLTKDGRKMILEVKTPEQVEMKIWTNESHHSYDSDNPGTLRVGFVSKVPAGKKAEFHTSLKTVK